MTASIVSDAQEAFVLKRGADGMPAAEIHRRAGIGQATRFKRKKTHGGLLPTEMKRPKPLNGEHGEDGELVADPSSDKAMLRHVIH